MSTLFFPSDTLTVYRRRRIAGTDRFNMSATYTGIPADLQPATKERIEMVDGRFGSVFTAFLDINEDVKEGDQLVSEVNQKKYSVKGIDKWQGAGILDYIELTLIAQDGY